MPLLAARPDSREGHEVVIESVNPRPLRPRRRRWSAGRRGGDASWREGLRQSWDRDPGANGPRHQNAIGIRIVATRVRV